jgi:hypothetical protein
VGRIPGFIATFCKSTGVGEGEPGRCLLGDAVVGLLLLWKKSQVIALCGIALVGVAVAVLSSGSPAGATGVAHITQPDGSVKTYNNVRIAIDSTSMTLTSSDRVGILYIGKAACTKFGELLKCLPYDATLEQHGSELHIPLKDGTAWLNPTAKAVTRPGSAARFAPHGVVFSMVTKAGTSLTLSGTADEIVK